MRHTILMKRREKMREVRIDVNGDQANTDDAVERLQEKLGDEWNVVASSPRNDRDLVISSMALSMNLLNLDQLKTVHAMVSEMVVEGRG